MSANAERDDESVKAPGEDQAKQQAGQTPHDAHPDPLFLRGGKDGRKGNAQDEKDDVGE